jgi:hypothetical protein
MKILSSLPRLITAICIGSALALPSCTSDTKERNSQMESDGEEQLRQDMDSLNAVLNDSDNAQNPRYGN